MENLGMIRQYFGELPADRTFTAKQLWDIFNTFAPLMTEKQQKDLIEALMDIKKP